MLPWDMFAKAGMGAIKGAFGIKDSKPRRKRAPPRPQNTATTQNVNISTPRESESKGTEKLLIGGGVALVFMTAVLSVVALTRK